MITGKNGGFPLRFLRVMEPSIPAITMIHRAVQLAWSSSVRPALSAGAPGITATISLHPCPRHSLRGTLFPMKALL